MTQYEIGSVANFVSQKPAEIKKKKTLQKNQSVLDQLFAASNDATNIVVANVPIPTEKKAKRKKLRQLRSSDQYAISNIQTSKKIQKNGKDSDEEEVEKILDGVPDDDMEEDDMESEKVSRKLKKNEMKNIKKNAESKGEIKEDSDRVILVKNLPTKVKRRSIHHFFAKFGKINAVWLRCAALGIF